MVRESIGVFQELSLFVCSVVKCSAKVASYSTQVCHTMDIFRCVVRIGNHSHQVLHAFSKRGRDQEHYPTASSNLHTQQFCGDTGSLKLWPVTVFGLSWWCVLNCAFLLMSKPSAGSSALNICDVNVDLCLSSSSLLSLDGLHCNNCHSQQEVQVASLGGLWPKLPPGSSQQPSPAVAAKKIDPSTRSAFLAWQRVPRAGVRPARPWVPLQTAGWQGQTPVPLASD